MPLRFFRYRKRLGQHFLNNKRLAQRIINFADVEDSVVLEVGSGKGMLTKQIAKSAKKIYAVEIDNYLSRRLEDMAVPNVIIINKDFLKLDLKGFEKPVIVGNIPYSITTAILQTLVNQRDYFERAILTIQKEYGERVLAKTGCRQYGAITLYLNYYFKIRKGFVIPAKYFSPKPKVSSVVISLIKKKPIFVLSDENQFFQFIRGIFRYRRKTLNNAIKNYLHTIPESIDHELLRKRPETLSLADFHHLYNLLKL